MSFFSSSISDGVEHCLQVGAAPPPSSIIQSFLDFNLSHRAQCFSWSVAQAGTVLSIFYTGPEG